jgi:excisionase family DNA binding protein
MTSSKRTTVALEANTGQYVTVGELARHWAVSRKQVYKHIEAGSLPAIRLGPRLLRIRVADAIEFQERARIRPAGRRPPGRESE